MAETDESALAAMLYDGVFGPCSNGIDDDEERLIDTADPEW